MGNLILPAGNPDMESALAGTWFTQGTGTITQDNTHVYTGLQAMKCDVLVNNDGTQYDNVRPLVTPLTAYTCTAYIYSVAGGSQWQVIFQGFLLPGNNNTGTLVNQYNGPGITLLPGQFTPVSITARASATETSFDIYVVQKNGSAETVWIDSLWMDVEPGSHIASWRRRPVPTRTGPDVDQVLKMYQGLR
jgi:hypothetical protein